MAKQQHGGRQGQLFSRSIRPTVAIEPSHRLVAITDELNWDELLELVESIRAEKLKNNAGRPPQLRALVGALLLKATRDMTLREAEDLIRHYAPARYLCGLTETEWSPDHNTLHDFETLMGESGVRRINEYLVKLAVKEKLASSQVVVGDTTAQEAAIPYPNEMRLMAAFMSSVAAASQQAGTKLREFFGDAKKTFQTARTTLRYFRLFAKTKEQRLKRLGEMMTHVRAVQRRLRRTLAVASAKHLTGYRQVAFARITKLHAVMKALLPQIQYWHRTGFVAAKKIINLGMSNLYSVPRGKVGKPIEFGLQWGITRLKGGFVLAHMGLTRSEVVDARYVVKSVDECQRLFGNAPRDYAYDRAGHSDANIAKLTALGVRNIALAPRGRRAWEVNDTIKRRLVSERIRVEGSIGTLKCSRYGFNRPRARSEQMMGVSGQRAVLGMNLNKFVKGLAIRNGLSLAID